ncbi:MAG TPA: flavodoxin-dependent (E)-4-hydroxy-3-methylbut-2-enyl-diphosphate synthase [bacterium]|nr:flavodoxin-dependent (E)-4-hydroxy-3-methylbut-2-enyl-diphosphate synthase [bacterium]
MLYTRNDTKCIKVRNVKIGGGNPITVQSMTNTDTCDIQATVDQIRLLASSGCDLVRLAIPNTKAANALVEIRQQVDVPLIADIHFKHDLAIKAIEAGVDKLRINPGNIGTTSKVLEIACAASEHGIPIRVGVNSGSLKKEILNHYGHPTPEALVESAVEEVDILNEMDFHDVCVSIKSSNVPDTIKANLLFAEKRNNPLHIGITEAGTLQYGTIKSCSGIGAILAHGIGDTIRVSLTANPETEVKTGIYILKAMGLRISGAEVISCPTCGRTEIDMIQLAEEVEKRASSIKKPIIIAVMGCIVNGPGEAREADYGIAGGKGFGLLFRKGQVVSKVAEEKLIGELFSLIKNDETTV